MTWIRGNIRPASRLALFALALQLVLSFGHFHPIAPVNGFAPQAISAGGPSQPSPDHDPDAAVDLCAICAVTAMAGTALSAAPPALPLIDSVRFDYRTADAGFLAPALRRAAFQPRAPPVS